MHTSVESSVHGAVRRETWPRGAHAAGDTAHAPSKLVGAREVSEMPLSSVSGPLPTSMCSLCGWACRATRAGRWEDKGGGVEGAMLQGRGWLGFIPLTRRPIMCGLRSPWSRRCCITSGTRSRNRLEGCKHEQPAPARVHAVKLQSSLNLREPCEVYIGDAGVHSCTQLCGVHMRAARADAQRRSHGYAQVRG